MSSWFWIFVLLFFTSRFATGQENREEIIAGIIEGYLPEESENAKLSELNEELLWIMDNPFDVNTVGPEELKKIHVLNDFQIYTFLEYREKYGRILSLKELELIPGFREREISLLSFFLSLSPSVKISATPKYRPGIRQKILNRYSCELPMREGFLPSADSSSSFLGPPLYRLLKYEISRGQVFKAGFTAESDAGEKSVFPNGKGFLSAYLMICPEKGPIKNILAGDFTLSSSSGLVFGKGLSGKSTRVIVKQQSSVLKKYSGGTEYGFFRGAAAGFSMGNFHGILFLSSIMRPGTSCIKDSSVFIESIYSQGLFRNEKEIMKQGSFRQSVTGMTAGFRSRYLGVEYNLCYTELSNPYLVPALTDRFSKKTGQKNFLNQSIGLSYRKGKFHTFGEFAMDGDFSYAWLQFLNLDVHPLLKISLSWRDYSTSYTSFYSSAFSEKADNRNERGFYAGFETYPLRRLKLSVYMDYYNFPWMDYFDDYPGYGTDLLLRGEWNAGPAFQIITLLKSECGTTGKQNFQKDYNEKETSHKSRFMIQSDYQATTSFSIRNKAEIKLTWLGGRCSGTGFLMYQEFRKTWLYSRISLDTRYTIFDIPGWEERIYNWEPGLLYSFSMPLYYHTGQSLLFNLRYNTGFMKFGLKFTSSHFTRVTGSGNGPDFRSSGIFMDLSFQWILTLN